MLSPKGPDSDSPDSLDSCLSYASHARPTQIGIGGKLSVSDLAISLGSGSCKLRSPILSVMKSKDLKTNLEPRRNLLVNLNSIDLM
jgi:hypothetical protein